MNSGIQTERFEWPSPSHEWPKLLSRRLSTNLNHSAVKINDNLRMYFPLVRVFDTLSAEERSLNIAARIAAKWLKKNNEAVMLTLLAWKCDSDNCEIRKMREKNTSKFSFSS